MHFATQAVSNNVFRLAPTRQPQRGGYVQSKDHCGREQHHPNPISDP